MLRERERERERERAYISKWYFRLLKEAADIVDVKLYSVELKVLGEICKCYDGTHQTPEYMKSGVRDLVAREELLEGVLELYSDRKSVV